MRIVNTTGLANDTKIFDDEGRDITGEMRVVRVVIEAGDRTRVQITCEPDGLDIVGDKA